MADDTFAHSHIHIPTREQRSFWVRYLSHSVRLRIHVFVRRHIAPIARHPAMTVVTGLGLFLSGIAEAFSQLFTDFESVIGAREGVIVLGVITFLKGLADLVEASEWLSKGIEEEEEQASHHAAT
jgi:uncharacterized membrane protein HdeD (DUF308 family)